MSFSTVIFFSVPINFWWNVGIVFIASWKYGNFACEGQVKNGCIKIQQSDRLFYILIMKFEKL